MPNHGGPQSAPVYDMIEESATGVKKLKQWRIKLSRKRHGR